MTCLYISVLNNISFYHIYIYIISATVGPLHFTYILVKEESHRKSFFGTITASSVWREGLVWCMFFAFALFFVNRYITYMHLALSVKHKSISCLCRLYTYVSHPLNHQVLELLKVIWFYSFLLLSCICNKSEWLVVLYIFFIMSTSYQ